MSSARLALVSIAVATAVLLAWCPSGLQGSRHEAAVHHASGQQPVWALLESSDPGVDSRWDLPCPALQHAPFAAATQWFRTVCSFLFLHTGALLSTGCHQQDSCSVVCASWQYHQCLGSLKDHADASQWLSRTYHPCSAQANNMGGDNSLRLVGPRLQVFAAAACEPMTKTMAIWIVLTVSGWLQQGSASLQEL